MGALQDSISQRARPGATRCPYCHEGCEARDACACAECLSRHHAQCWAERGGCSSCGSRQLLTQAGRVQAHPLDVQGYAGAVEAWFRLWKLYNTALTAVTVVTLGTRLLWWAGIAGATSAICAAFMIVFPVLLGALIANTLFCIGPGAELLARRLGYDGLVLRWVLFAGGLFLAAVLAFLCSATAPLWGQ